MKFVQLILKNAWRSKLRTLLTILSTTVALFLFCMLRTIVTSLDATTEVADESRLVVRRSTSLTFPLPLAYAERFAHLSPGSFLIQQVLRTLAGAGVSTVVSHGAHEYKRRWSSRFVSSPRTFLFAPSLRASSARFIRFQAAPLWRWLRLREP